VSPDSMPAPAASTPASPASADLAVLRAAPARPAATAAQGADARDPALPGKESPAGGARTGTAGPNARAAVATPAGDAAPTNTATTFGQTLAASMTASAAPAQPVAAQPATATPARSLKGKSTDTKPADAQTAASANPANQALIAAGLIPQSFSPGAAGAGAGFAGDAQAQAPAIAAAIAAAIAPAIAPAAAPAAAASPSVAQPPVNMTVTGALKASEPEALELPRGTAAPGPDEDAPAAAEISAPTRATLQSALSAAIRIQGRPESGSSSNQAAGSGNDLAGIGAALSGAAASTSAAAQAPPAAAPQSTANVTVQVHSEVGSSSWATELGTRLHWMAGAGIGSASLRLTPAELGPVEVKISVHQNAASVWFSAAQPDTRTALEQALPRLRELFSAQGMNLAQAGVSDQSARSAPREPEAGGARAAAGRELTATSIPSATRTHQGLIDTYA